MAGNNDLLTGTDDQRNDTLSAAQHSRALFISEPAHGKSNGKKNEEIKFNLTLIKKLTGGDTINVRKTHSNKLIIYKAHFKIFILCNRLPEIDENNNSTQRRFKFIHFPFNFVENPTKPNERLINKNLKTGIKENDVYYKTFMNLILKRAYENKNKSIKVPKKYEEFKQEYFNSNDIIQLYIDRRLEKTGNEKDSLLVSEIFEDFKNDKEKVEYMTAKKFTMLLKEKFELYKSHGYKVLRGYKFTKLINNNEDINNEDVKLYSDLDEIN